MFVFEASWEVCNKVGGIYTVLSSHAKALQESLGKESTLVFVGPELWKETPCPFFEEDPTLFPDWKQAVLSEGATCRIGRWLVPGKPIAVLVDFEPLFPLRDKIYGEAWQHFGVDSLHGYGDYDEASLFAYMAARFAYALVKHHVGVDEHVVYHAHEWMAALGMLFIKKWAPQVRTVFTTHATSIGRSITTNNKELYTYFSQYNGDLMARELNMEAKHSVEKQAALHADCFTTVSKITARECGQFLGRTPDLILPNGFEDAFVARGPQLTAIRRRARRRIIDVAEALTGDAVRDDVTIITTSGRNDFRCKGFDVFIQALANLKQAFLQEGATETRAIALIEVPCWTKGPRYDLQERLYGKTGAEVTPATTMSARCLQEALPIPQLTHELYNTDEDRILQMIRSLQLDNASGSPIKVFLVPCYLEGEDGIYNLPYYDLLAGADICIYPSYYEPWGYTPLEATAFRTPTITTDLAGFGLWVKETTGREMALEDGVGVLHRDDHNYFECAEEISASVLRFLQLPTAEKANVRRRAASIAERASWKKFIPYYIKAYTPQQ